MACVCFLLVAFSILAASAADTAQWSFQDHPHPGSGELTEAEMASLEPGTLDAKGETGCIGYVNAMYRIYLGRYPAYAKMGDHEESFRLWRKYMVTGKEKFGDSCLLVYPFLKISYLYSTGTKIENKFCGNRNIKYLSNADRFVISFFYEMLFYFKSTNFSDYTIAGNLLRSNGYDEFSELNPDIEYYLRRFLAADEQTKPEYTNTSRLEPLLDAERKAFVERAVANRDFQSVIDTIAPCKTRSAAD